MKWHIGFLVMAMSASWLFADEAAADLTPQAVARQVNADMLAGKSAQVKMSIPANLAVLEKGAKDFPADPQIQFALASCYMMQNRLAAALPHMEIAYAKARQDVSIGRAYVLALKMNKQSLRAYEVNRELAADHPEDAVLRFSAAYIGMLIQKYDEAIVVFEDMRGKMPDTVDPKEKSTLMYALGTCYLYQGEHEKAIKALEEAVSLNPRAVVAQMMLAEAYLKSNDWPKAGETLDKVLAMNSQYPAALYWGGIIFEKAGQAEKAQKCFGDAYAYGKKRLQDNGSDYYLMSQVSEKLCKPDEAKTYKAEAAKLLFTHEAPLKEKNAMSPSQPPKS